MVGGFKDEVRHALDGKSAIAAATIFYSASLDLRGTLETSIKYSEFASTSLAKMNADLKIIGRASSINVRKVLWTCRELDLPFEFDGE